MPLAERLASLSTKLQPGTEQGLVNKTPSFPVRDDTGVQSPLSRSLLLSLLNSTKAQRTPFGLFFFYCSDNISDDCWRLTAPLSHPSDSTDPAHVCLAGAATNHRPDLRHFSNGCLGETLNYYWNQIKPSNLLQKKT